MEEDTVYVLLTDLQIITFHTSTGDHGVREAGVGLGVHERLDECGRDGCACARKQGGRGDCRGEGG